MDDVPQLQLPKGGAAQMAKRRAMGRPAPRGDQRIRGVTTQAAQLLDASMIPRVLVSTVDGAEALAVGVLQLARSVDFHHTMEGMSAALVGYAKSTRLRSSARTRKRIATAKTLMTSAA
jgi:hypothetical protein